MLTVPSDFVSNEVVLRIVMPVHNAGAYLEEALTSVVAGLTDRMELVVVDDGSSDGSPEILTALLRRVERATLIRHDLPQGVSKSLNAAISLPGTPRFVAVAEHDDVMYGDRLACQLDFLIKNEDFGAVSSCGRYIGSTGRIRGFIRIGPRSDGELAAMKADAEPLLVLHACIMYRTSAVVTAGLYDPAFDGAQDLELLNRMVYDFGWSIRTLDKVHLLYRIHSGATSFAKFAEQRSITRFVRYRNRCAVTGQEATSYEQWLSLSRSSQRDRLRWWRHDVGARNFRRAGFYWLQASYFRSGWFGLGAVLFHPEWVLVKLRRQVMERRKDGGV